MSSTGFPRVPVWAIVGLLIVSALVASTATLGMGPSSSSHLPSAAAALSPLAAATPNAVTNGDLTVGAGQVLVIQHNVTNGGVFPIAGNITVVNGGQLTFIGMTVLFEQFTATGNTWWAADLHYRYHIAVEGGNGQPGGRLWLDDSTITSDPDTQNTYLKLNLSIGDHSVLGAVGSQLNFPGSIYVNGSSALFMNGSVLQSDKITPTDHLSQNFSDDNAYAASLDVASGSQLVADQSQFLDTYANPDTSSPFLELGENFAQPGPQALSTTGTTTFSGLVPATALGLDSGAPWSTGSVRISYSNPTATTVTAPVTFSAFATNDPVGSMTFLNDSNGTISLPLSGAFVSGTLNVQGFQNLLSSMQAGTADIAIGAGTAGAAGVSVEQAALSLTPEFQFNMTFSGSLLEAVNSLFDINYHQPPGSTCSATVPFQSNKLDLVDISQAFLLNSSSTTYFLNGTGQCVDVPAFVPDATSQIWDYGWAAVDVRSGSNNVEDALITASSAVSSITSPWVNSTANQYSSAHFLNGTVPNFYGAISTAALAYEGSGAPRYGNTSSDGSALIALATNWIDSSNLPTGNFIGDYNLRSSELATTLNNTQVPAFSHTSTPGMCSWPTTQACQSPVSTVPIQMPLLSAELVVVSSNVYNVQATNPTCVALVTTCQVYETNTVGLNLTVHDLNDYQILGATSIPVALYDGYSAGAGPSYNTSYMASVTNGDLSAATGTYQMSITFKVPTASAGTHSLYAVVDPGNVVPMTTSGPTTVGTSFFALGIPIFTASGVAVTAWDACTQLQVTANLPNSCNSITLKAQVTNQGDAAADGVSLTFAINGVAITGGTTTFPVIGSLGVGTASVNTNVTPTDSPLGNITAVVTWSSVTPINPPAAEMATGFSQVPFTDYTQLGFNAAETQAVTPLGTNKLILNEPAVPQATTAIGSWLEVKTQLNNTGGPASNAHVSLVIVQPHETNYVRITNQTFGVPTGTFGQGVTNYSLIVGWHVNQTIIRSATGSREFGLEFNWTDGTKNLGLVQIFYVNIQPAPLHFKGVVFTPETVAVSSDQSSEYEFDGGVVSFLGGPSGTFISLNISFTNDAQTVNESLAEDAGLLFLTQVANGTNLASLLPFTIPSDLGVGSYNLVIQISYNGAQAWYTVQDAFTLTSTPTSTPWYENPLYLAIIAAAIVAAIVIVIVVLRSMGKGKLVECGECGELIPENATACPRCGAEFETDMVRCSRCGSTIPAASNVCPECSVTLLGKEDEAAAKDPQRSAYEDFTQRFRTEARRELGENYSEGAFWDWWKRQPSFLSFSAWKMQQAQGTRTGMTVPTGDREDAQVGPEGGGPGYGGQPPRGGGGAGGGAGGMPPAGPAAARAAPPSARPAPRPGAGAPQAYPPAGAAAAAPAAAGPGAAAPSGGMKTCSSCGREINADFLVCPFCSAVTR